MNTENDNIQIAVPHDARKKVSEHIAVPNSNPILEAAQKRREQIKKLEARLQRAKARNSVATRRERNGQLYVWGAMVEGVYRSGSEHERRLLREWAERQLTDKRHLHRSECGFGRIDDENEESATE